MRSESKLTVRKLGKLGQIGNKMVRENKVQVIAEVKSQIVTSWDAYHIRKDISFVPEVSIVIVQQGWSDRARARAENVVSNTTGDG